LAELRSLLKPGENVRLYAISVDSPEQSKGFAEKIAADGKGPVSFQMLSDPGHQVIDGYGIRDPEYNGQKFEGIPHPSVYVIDKTGHVAWSKFEEDYKKRPGNTEIRDALDALRG
jgi:peroxiredoxin